MLASPKTNSHTCCWFLHPTNYSFFLCVQRELYRYVNELMVPSEQLSHYQPPSAEDLCSHFAPDGQVSLDPSKVEWGSV